jgi:hypothetical protein
MKNCKICNNEFEQKIVRGNEQIYCSDKCRQQGYLQRKAADTTTGANAGSMGLQNPNNIQARFNPPGEVIRANFESIGVNAIEQLEKTYEAKTEALKWEMKFNQVAKEIDELKNRNNVLTMQLESAMDDDGNDDDGGGLIGTIIKNPQPVILFVNYFVDKIFEYQKLKQPTKTA